MPHSRREVLIPTPTIGASATMTDAAQMMCEHGVSALAVIDRCGKSLFTITYRDILLLTAQALDPRTLTIEQFVNRRCGRAAEHWFG
jgi:CBS domain-containing protein